MTDTSLLSEEELSRIKYCMSCAFFIHQNSKCLMGPRNTIVDNSMIAQCKLLGYRSELYSKSYTNSVD